MRVNNYGKSDLLDKQVALFLFPYIIILRYPSHNKGFENRTACLSNQKKVYL